jgi:kumamolisin
VTSTSYVELPGSHRQAPHAATAIREVAPGEPVEVSVYLREAGAKDPGDDPLLKLPPVGSAEAAAKIPAQHSRPDMRAARAHSYAQQMDKVVEFAHRMGLTVVEQDPARRLIKLAGPAEKFEAAFRTKLSQYHDGRQAFRARVGSLSAPSDVADAIEAVLGLDTRPVAAPRLRRHMNPHAVGGHLPNQVAALYGFPQTPGMGKGQCIALLELGGGYRDSDNQLAFKAMKLATPQVVPVSVAGGQNRPGVDTGADGEVALDIQVAGGAAPGAKIAVYFAPNTTRGFVDAITRAVHDEQNRPSVISISWGSAESNWTAQALRAMTTALSDAAHLGVTVFAASGDNLATDGESDGHAHVDFPASSPYVVGCGGTRIDTSASSINAETVWNTGDSGTGGGVSDVYPVPGYQANAHIPKSVSSGKAGRGVPDVAGDADPNSGYRIVVGGSSGLIGGTSAVAPLWAGLFALVNEACGKPAGFIHPLLYGNAGALREITTGDNKIGGIGYPAGAGWNACTGLGVPVGGSVLALFKEAGHKAATTMAAA